MTPPGQQDSKAFHFVENSTCERCGRRFVCGGVKLEACWCAEVELSDSARALLRGRYQNCLCPACLQQFAEVNNPPAEHD